MSSITEFLQEKAPAVIAELPDEFTTRQFIWKLAEEYEADYVRMLFETYNDNNEQPRVFHNLHSKIGRYLLEHAKELHIEKRREAKEMDINPFGRKTPTQPWRKIR